MSGRVKKPPAPKRKANGYKMPSPIATGEVIHDVIGKKKWRIGPSIGVGGFGEIYSACDHESSPKKGSLYPFVVKIEPHENGPLFVEKHFYCRNANKDDVAKFMKTRKLSSLGMPTYHGNGSHEYKGEKYRYLVLERYGKDVWSLFKECGRAFPAVTVFQLGLQMLDVLEYIHSRGYVHADIKGANILMGLRKGTENQAYLVDFGLASRVTEKEFKPDPKCAHNGTIEYTSRDAHLGVPTMRGDLEILGYNMLQWLVGELPWEKSLKQPKTVQDMKETLMKNVRANITKQYSNVPEALIKFFEYINTLKPKDIPDYTKCRAFFESYLKSEGKTKTSKLNFSPVKKGKQSRTGKTVVADSDADEGDEEEPIANDKKLNGVTKTKRGGRKPKVVSSSPEVENCENEEPDSEDDTKKKKLKPTVRKPKIVKRKSIEPSVVVKVKKTKLAPKATPPVKKNHVNIATQTSVEKRRKSPRQVSFDSPICEIIGNKKQNISNGSDINSSGDIFDDSFTIEEKKVKPRRKLLSNEEIIIKRVVKKKVTTTVPKTKSWKDAPTVMNGRSPPK
ncbi:serine/threonine-protein kinase VRK1 [Achroia grisella]|uniref:serine/threonine-protein kinase VRK1 n=1 Tax=Achroia grisella TaxID=688607 RepID=UPI0027D27C48|nr:serine/threonine-protein kinase VRK1 [Achroia grisella]